MKISKCKLLFLGTTLSFSSALLSCEKDWFDIKSDKNVTVLTTLDDFEKVMDNYDIMSRSPAIGEIASDGHFTTDAVWVTLSDNYSGDIVQKNAYTWTKRNLNTEVNDWNMPYSVIFNCNLVIEGMGKIERTMGNKGQYDRVLGNALFHRARSYYELSQIFTPPYDPKKDSPYGLPIKLETDVAEQLKRSSVHDTFKFIEEDLKRAVELLPERAAPLTRGSKAACWILLSRISLITENFEKSLVYANNALKIFNVLLDFNQVPVTVSNLGQFNSEVVFHTEMMNHTLSFHPRYCFIDPQLYAQYEDDDLRKFIYFRESSTGITFKGMYNNRILQFGGFATDEIYLLKAEACARTKRIDESMLLINTLLKSRYRRNLDGNSTLVNRTAADELEALSIIFAERNKELLLRGIRWADLRRLGRDSRFLTTLRRTINGETYVLPPNSPKYAFPIPDDEISFSRIPQNPGRE